MSRKAQGLPMNALVLGALALLVLVAAAGMFVSGGGIFSGFSQTIGSSSPSTLRQARTICSQACNDLKFSELPPASLENHNLCTETFDLSEDLGDSDETSVNCYESPLSEPCTYRSVDASTYCTDDFECFDDSDCADEETNTECNTDTGVCQAPSS